MTAHNNNATTAFNMTAKLELTLGLWLCEMSGPSDALSDMAARIAQLDNRHQVLKRAA